MGAVSETSLESEAQYMGKKDKKRESWKTILKKNIFCGIELSMIIMYSSDCIS